jgi:serine-type D-Ala-D-Ala carboxypeptidase (penicillin-binding protein 5/6)
MLKSAKYISYLLLVSILSFSINPNLFAFADFDLPAETAVLMEAKTGQVLYQKDGETPLPPASITKIMTLLLAFEELDSGRVNWDDLVTVSQKAWEMEGSTMFLNIDQKVSYGDLITGISVVSANDACVAIAEHIFGSEQEFVSKMNLRASSLGLQNTNFKNATGWPQEGHYMSAMDIAVLARYLVNTYPKILEIESMSEFTFNNIKQYNRNPLLGKFDGADGLKTGWTTEAGYCLVGTAMQNDTRMIAVVLKTDSETQRLASSRTLLNHGFRNFVLQDVALSGEDAPPLTVQNAKEKFVPIQIKETLSAVVPIESKNEISKEITIKDTLKAPLPAGTVVGEMVFSLDGRPIGRVDLVTVDDAPKANFLVLLFRRLLKLFGIG